VKKNGQSIQKYNRECHRLIIDSFLFSDPFSATDGESQTPKQRNPISRSSQDYQKESLMDIEYEDLLKKVIEHQAEIEEAEKLLHVQKVKHEADKQNMIEQFNAEKTNMQQIINNERGSMEKAMQNLINEIVRLKEERNEIRKNNRIEKEKLVVAFENERTQWLSSNEEMKNEIEGKLEKKFQDDLEKVKKEMKTRETELKEEMVKLKDERNNLVCGRDFLSTIIKFNNTFRLFFCICNANLIIPAGIESFRNGRQSWG
jgi:DNA polymerase III alpha subunit (gram-positive type)